MGIDDNRDARHILPGFGPPGSPSVTERSDHSSAPAWDARPLDPAGPDATRRPPGSFRPEMEPNRVDAELRRRFRLQDLPLRRSGRFGKRSTTTQGRRASSCSSRPPEARASLAPVGRQTQIWDHRKGAGRDRRAGRAARPSSRICPAADGTTSPRAEIRAPGGPRLWTDMCCPRARCTRTTLAPESTARMATRVWASRPQSRPHPHRSLFHMPSPHCSPASSSCLRRWVRRMRPARHYPTAASLISDSSR
jgi:hypothetical protein